MFSLICVWIKSWVNNREAGDLRRYRAHYDVTVKWYDCHNTSMPMIISAYVTNQFADRTELLIV